MGSSEANTIPGYGLPLGFLVGLRLPYDQCHCPAGCALSDGNIFQIQVDHFGYPEQVPNPYHQQVELRVSCLWYRDRLFPHRRSPSPQCHLYGLLAGQAQRAIDIVVRLMPSHSGWQVQLGRPVPLRFEERRHLVCYFWGQSCWVFSRHQQLLPAEPLHGCVPGTNPCPPWPPGGCSYSHAQGESVSFGGKGGLCPVPSFLPAPDTPIIVTLGLGRFLGRAPPSPALTFISPSAVWVPTSALARWVPMPAIVRRRPSVAAVAVPGMFHAAGIVTSPAARTNILSAVSSTSHRAPIRSGPPFILVLGVRWVLPGAAPPASPWCRASMWVRFLLRDLFFLYRAICVFRVCAVGAIHRVAPIPRGGAARGTFPVSGFWPRRRLARLGQVRVWVTRIFPACVHPCCCWLRPAVFLLRRVGFRPILFLLRLRALGGRFLLRTPPRAGRRQPPRPLPIPPVGSWQGCREAPGPVLRWALRSDAGRTASAHVLVLQSDGAPRTGGVPTPACQVMSPDDAAGVRGKTYGQPQVPVRTRSTCGQGIRCNFSLVCQCSYSTFVAAAAPRGKLRRVRVHPRTAVPPARIRGVLVAPVFFLLCIAGCLRHPLRRRSGSAISCASVLLRTAGWSRRGLRRGHGSKEALPVQLAVPQLAQVPKVRLSLVRQPKPTVPDSSSPAPAWLRQGLWRRIGPACCALCRQWDPFAVLVPLAAVGALPLPEQESVRCRFFPSWLGRELRNAATSPAVSPTVFQCRRRTVQSSIAPRPSTRGPWKTSRPEGRPTGQSGQPLRWLGPLWPAWAKKGLREVWWLK